MDEIFTPSLLIAAGTSSNKTLLHVKTLLSGLPQEFLDLVDFYETQDILSASRDIQKIVDDRLLSARALNKLVDMGYKVRDESIGFVRLNLYIFWELKEEGAAILELVRQLSMLNYGNIDPSQHSGVSMFIIPILEKHWTLEAGEGSEGIHELRELKAFLSQRENMLRMDSKIYLLHSITKDGTRISKEELQQISALAAYLNIIPTKEPPLSGYNRRVLMHEGGYKLGTLGITALMLSKDRLRDDLKVYLAGKVINHAVVHVNEGDAENYDSKTYEIISLDEQCRVVRSQLGCVDGEGGLKLSQNAQEELQLSHDLAGYSELVKTWSNKIDSKQLPELKEKIAEEARETVEEEIKACDRKLEEIISSSSLKDGVNYLDAVLQGIKDHSLKVSRAQSDNLLEMENKLALKIKSCTSISHIIMRAILLSALLSLILIGLIIPNTNGDKRFEGMAIFILASAAATFLDYEYRVSKLKKFVGEYKKEFLTARGAMLNSYIEACVLKERERLSTFILEKKREINTAIYILGGIEREINEKYKAEVSALGNISTELFRIGEGDFKYREIAAAEIDVSEIYRRFIEKLGGYKTIATEEARETVKEKLLYVLDSAVKLEDNELYDYFQLKYKGNSTAELHKWMNTALVKSKSLLQYVDVNLEEHLTFIASSHFSKLLKLSEGDNVNKLSLSFTAPDHLRLSCMAVVRVTLGLELENIIPVRSNLVAQAAQYS